MRAASDRVRRGRRDQPRGGVREIFAYGRNEDALPRASGSFPPPFRSARSAKSEKNHKGLREAPTLDAKMKIYAELVERQGASMLGGQVGMSSTKWDLELKGYENFPAKPDGSGSSS